MSLKVETVMLGPETDQYAGKGQHTTTLGDIAEAARYVESLGYDGTTTAEAGHDPFLPLMIAAEHTEKISLGTNVAIAFPRSPMVTAQIAWDLQNLSKGRFKLGLGTQVKGHNERRYATPWTGKPGPRLREYIECLTAMFATFRDGKNPTFFEGDHYTFKLMSPFFNPGPIPYDDPKIYIGSFKTYTAKMAGELCDGIRIHPISSFAHVRDVVVPAIADGASKADRKRSDVDVIGAPFLAVAKDEAGVEKAKQALKQHISFYASTRTYHSVLEYHGWEDVGMKLHELSVAGKWQELPAQITDAMLDEWAIIATCDDFAAAIKNHCSGLFDTVLLDLPPKLSADRDWVTDVISSIKTG